MGNRTFAGLLRTHAIPKSSGNFTAATRPTFETNLNSLSIQPQLVTEKNIIIVDDFLTLGRSTLAAALKVKKAFPDKEVKIFSAFRTRGNDLNVFVDPQQGTMSLNAAQNDVILPD
ncbi:MULTISPECIES: phosphoribosyltransferase [Chryseobacterium]|uniref:phosphoribosyltransferase n=1 Tax=Chryseobacterium TaxID=59732 RepID=UPI00135A131C|nr:MULTISPECIES: phosphoribosyltransferase [Chryseobacterium]